MAAVGDNDSGLPHHLIMGRRGDDRRIFGRVERRAFKSRAEGDKHTHWQVRRCVQKRLDGGALILERRTHGD